MTRVGKWWVRLFRRIAPWCVLLTAASAARPQVAVTVAFAPPGLPVYEQPPCPAEDYIWEPGYWAWGGDDYFWVPGTWVMAPEVGLFWTPGYWGPAVGFYGGIVYGFGYFGHGYEGGRWDHGHFFYNREVNNVNVTVIHNVYNTTVVNRNVNVTRVSYNGGNGGVNAQPTREEEAASREKRVAMTPLQTQHFDAARQNRELRASVNQGKPPIAASARPAEFHGQNVVAARQGERYTPPPNRTNAVEPGGGNHTRPAIHPNDLPPFERAPANPSAATSKEEQKYQKQQEKMYEKQVQERQKLQQQQDKDHQQALKHQADEQYKQQMEQRHQQQTEHMQQRQVEQQHQIQQHAPAPPPAPPHQAPPPHHN